MVAHHVLFHLADVRDGNPRLLREIPGQPQVAEFGRCTGPLLNPGEALLAPLLILMHLNQPFPLDHDDHSSE